MQTIIDTYWTE